jgi:hypothetical protein
MATASAGQTGSGTGVLLAEERPGRVSAVILVTNKHVIAWADRVALYLIAAGSSDTPALGTGLTLTCTPSQFVGHPDPEIDVAMIGVGGGLGRAG